MNSGPAISIEVPTSIGAGGLGIGNGVIVKVQNAMHASTEPVSHWVLGLLQAADSFYPTGGYAHSFALEALVTEGVVRDLETLRTYFRLAVLPALLRFELPIVAHAWSAFAETDWGRLAEVCTLAAAAKPANELRLASEKIGRQRAELAAVLHPSSVAHEYVERARAEGWSFAAPISAALEGVILGAPAQATLAAHAYSTLAGQIAAAVKLLRIGQTGAQVTMTDALKVMPKLIAAATATPITEIGWFAPWVDIASARHESADARMFIS